MTIARGNATAVAHIADAQRHQVAGSQFAGDRKIEQGKFAGSVCDLKTDTNCPDILQLPSRLLPDQLPFNSRGRAALPCE
jgi:hypothetical protein